jgi:hypothetical protein
MPHQNARQRNRFQSKKKLCQKGRGHECRMNAAILAGM